MMEVSIMYKLDWFLYDRGLRNEWVKALSAVCDKMFGQKVNEVFNYFRKKKLYHKCLLES